MPTDISTIPTFNFGLPTKVGSIVFIVGVLKRAVEIIIIRVGEVRKPDYEVNHCVGVVNRKVATINRKVGEAEIEVGREENEVGKAEEVVAIAG